MDILCQSLKKKTKFNYNSNNTFNNPFNDLFNNISDSPERPKLQTSVWVAGSKATGKNTFPKFNSKAKQTDSEGKVSYNSFDSNIKLMVSKTLRI